MGSAMPAEFMHPVAAERAYTDSLLEQAAGHWAPGPGSVDWQDWAQATKEQADTALPGLVRIGTTERGVPYLTSLLSEGHVAVGDSALLVPTPTPVIGRVDVSKVNLVKKQAEAAWRAAEHTRRGRLEEERQLAVGITQGLIVRSIASLAPGTVSVTVYDPRSRGRDFRWLAPMNEGGQMGLRITGLNDLSTLLRSLDGRITAMNGGLLRGNPSLRAQIIREGVGQRPWRIVVLLGNNERLSAENQERLQAVVEQGPACGISLIVHGFDIGKHPHVSRLALGADGSAHASNSGPMRFSPDAPPPPEVMVQAAAGTIRHPDSVLVRPYAPALPTGLQVDGVGEGRRLRPGVHYRHITAERHAREAQVAALMEEFEAAHPALSPNSLAALESSRHGYLDFANRAAAWPAEARARLNSRQSGADLVVERLDGWAMLELLTDVPGHGREWLTRINKGTLSGGDIDGYVRGAIDLVQMTRAPGLDTVPIEARGYIARRLPADIPPYIFQLVADLGATSGQSLPRAQADRAWEATVTHLEQTYGVQLHRANSQPDGQLADRALAECLIECELLRLYDFAQAAPELRVLLAQRAHRRLRAVKDVPTFAQSLRRECLEFLEAAGGPVLSRRHRAALAAGSAAAEAGSKLRKAIQRRNSGEPNAGGTQDESTGARTPDPRIFTPEVYIPGVKGNEDYGKASGHQ